MKRCVHCLPIPPLGNASPQYAHAISSMCSLIHWWLKGKLWLAHSIAYFTTVSSSSFDNHFLSSWASWMLLPPLIRRSRVDFDSLTTFFVSRRHFSISWQNFRRLLGLLNDSWYNWIACCIHCSVKSLASFFLILWDLAHPGIFKRIVTTDHRLKSEMLELEIEMPKMESGPKMESVMWHAIGTGFLPNGFQMATPPYLISRISGNSFGWGALTSQI